MSESLPLPPPSQEFDNPAAAIDADLQGALAVAQVANRRLFDPLNKALRYAEYYLHTGRYWSNELPRRMRENPEKTWRAVGGIVTSFALAGGVANCVNEIRESEPIECVTEVLQPGGVGIGLLESAAERLKSLHPEFDPNIDPRLAEIAGFNSRSRPGEKMKVCLYDYPSPIDLFQPHYTTVEIVAE